MTIRWSSAGRASSTQIASWPSRPRPASAWVRSWWRYVLLSLAVCAGLLLLLPLEAMVVSAKSYQEIGETAMVYLVVMYYPFTLGLAGLVRLLFNRRGRNKQLKAPAP